MAFLFVQSRDHCGFFQWFVDPIPLRLSQIISGLLKRIDKKEREVKAAKRKGRKWKVVAWCLIVYILVEKFRWGK